jgi:ATP-binding cassette, subfamily F, member 3
MIKFANISLSFGAQTVFEDISFHINNGERIGLVGRNGSGKTTLLKLITKEIEPDAGKVIFPKDYTIGYVQQHLAFSKPTILEEACLGLKPEDEHNVWKAEKILTGLGFSPKEFERAPAEYSGGFQVRLHLAKTLIAEPNLLLLDEPTNYLDIVSIRWLVGFLRKWDGELILITHDRAIMNSITTHTMAVHRQKIKKLEGDTVKIYTQIATEEEQHERARVRESREREKTMEFIDRFRAQASRASMVQSRIKALERQGVKEELKKVQELGFSFNPAPFKAHQMMRIENVSFGYTPEKILIQDLSLEINAGDRICVIGKNGKGKSTLLRIFQNELTPTKGKIFYHQHCERGYFGQTNLERLNPKNTIVEELATVNPLLKYAALRNTAGAMMFSGDLALKPISILSGGEKSRVSLGKILLSPTNLLLLDEPTNHLDSESCDSLIAALDNFEGVQIIVTHNELFLHHLATRLIVFKDNVVRVFEGSYQDFLDKEGWEEATTTPSKAKEQKKNPIKTGQPSNNKQKKDLLKNIELLEKQIQALETKHHGLTTTLTEAITLGNTSKIKELQIDSHHLSQEITKHYAQMETALETLNNLEKPATI